MGLLGNISSNSATLSPDSNLPASLAAYFQQLVSWLELNTEDHAVRRSKFAIKVKMGGGR